MTTRIVWERQFRARSIVVESIHHIHGPGLRWYACSAREKQSQNDATTAARNASKPSPLSASSFEFWKCTSTWQRAAVNTSRCLVGCTLGDFSAMWSLQTYCPEMGMGAIMAVSMTSGLTTSMMLETVLLRMGRDRLSWLAAAKTAAGMSLISMLTMELAQNVVDYHLTRGTVTFSSPAFWGAAAASLTAGFLTPLPYNYLRLKKYGKACH